MSRFALGAVLMALWSLTGVAIGLRAARSGHNASAWLVLGVPFGPLLWGLWRASARRKEDARAVIVETGTPGAGSVNVLAGIDGSADAEASLATAVDLLGDRIGRLTLAAVLDYDTAESEVSGAVDRAAATAHLERAAKIAGPGHSPSRIILPGRPCDALRDFAESDGDDIIVIGTRGRGLSSSILGSTARALAHHCPTPVLIVSAPLSAAATARPDAVAPSP